jgi:hypothetical protein
VGESGLRRFDPVPARHVRLHCTKPAVDWQDYCIFELAVYRAIP